MEKTYEEYELWRRGEGAECNEDPKLLSDAYNNALTKLQTLLPFEDKLRSAQNKVEELDIYKTYLNFEKQKGDPGRITVLYERAIADLSLEPTIWLDYIGYVQSNLKIDDITEKLYGRAIKNVPWCVEIWQKYLIYNEKRNKPLTDMQTLMEDALSIGFASSEDYKNLWMCYLVYLRRYYYQAEDESKSLKILQNNFNKACSFSNI